MSGQNNKWFVITGGPGVGKTTLLTELERNGFQVVPEDARRIIKEQIMLNGEGLPWKNKELYAQLMLQESIRSYRQVKSLRPFAGNVFFDRSILDVVCYMKMEGIVVSADLQEQIKQYPYQSPVFILPPWMEIYETDGERKQTWTEAKHTFEAMKQTYIHYGYEVIEVPKDTVANRVQFVLKTIGNR